ncbi:MAG: prepilin-type N-terminal cleavage/methylation domain-containing protein [Candidatus Omnitrophica bacterium]|nr:prepilin-type N-terminal cleavage/methylation domain-containing protein [Candidatus Omnitrophota bacterium]
MFTAREEDKLTRLSGFTLIEVILAITIIILIYIGATTAQISSEIFLKNIRTDFEKHLELNNAIDHIVKSVRRSKFGGGFPRSPNPQTLLLRIDGIPGVVNYSQSGDNILCSFETNPIIAKDAQINFSVTGPLVKITIMEDLDSQEKDKIPIFLSTQAYARDK